MPTKVCVVNASFGFDEAHLCEGMEEGVEDLGLLRPALQDVPDEGVPFGTGREALCGQLVRQGHRSDAAGTAFELGLGEGAQ